MVAEDCMRKACPVKKLTHDLRVLLNGIQLIRRLARDRITANDNNLAGRAEYTQGRNIKLGVYIPASPSGNANCVDFAPSCRLAFDVSRILINPDCGPSIGSRGIEAAPVPPVSTVQVDGKTCHRHWVGTVKQELKTLAHGKVEFEAAIPGCSIYFCAAEAALHPQSFPAVNFHERNRLAAGHRLPDCSGGPLRV